MQKRAVERIRIRKAIIKRERGHHAPVLTDVRREDSTVREFMARYEFQTISIHNHSFPRRKRFIEKLLIATVPAGTYHKRGITGEIRRRRGNHHSRILIPYLL